jgi:hypothetical protein
MNPTAPRTVGPHQDASIAVDKLITELATKLQEYIAENGVQTLTGSAPQQGLALLAQLVAASRGVAPSK